MRNYGFTLLELILVILLIAILTSVGMRNSTNFYPSRIVYDQTRQLKSKLILIQELAKNFCQEVVVENHDDDHVLSVQWSLDNKKEIRKLSFSTDVVIKLPDDKLRILPSGNLYYNENDQQSNRIILRHAKYLDIENQIVFDNKILEIKRENKVE